MEYGKMAVRQPCCRPYLNMNCILQQISEQNISR